MHWDLEMASYQLHWEFYESGSIRALAGIMADAFLRESLTWSAGPRLWVFISS